MICPVCRKRFDLFLNRDYYINEWGGLSEKEGGYFRRMKIYWNDEEQVCSPECRHSYLKNCREKGITYKKGIDRLLLESYN